MTATQEIPTHCIKGHFASWCTCKYFRPALNGSFTDFPMIQYPPAIVATPPRDSEGETR